MKYKHKWLLLPAIALALLVQNAFSHAKGENYIFLEIKDDHMLGRFEFRYDDLKEKMGIDLLTNEKASDELLQSSTRKMHEYIRSNFAIGPEPDKPYEIEFTTASLFDTEGGFAQYYFRLNSGVNPEFLHVQHNMFYENDRIHRGVLVLEKGVWPSDDYEMHIAMVFSKSNNEQVLDLSDIPDLMTPIDMIWQGVLHIWIGIDHILFLLALALPIVLVMKNGTWQPAPKLGASLWNLLRIVTVFTIAHSVTLALASLDIVTLPSRLVESVIALSIILVAINNIRGRSQNTSLLIILFLGLFHGLGFASVMADLPFRIAETKEFILIILGFNFGVELGQLAILVVVFPLLFVFRKFNFYSPIVLKGGSIVLIAIASYWFVERAFAL